MDNNPSNQPTSEPTATPAAPPTPTEAEPNLDALMGQNSTWTPGAAAGPGVPPPPPPPTANKSKKNRMILMAVVLLLLLFLPVVYFGAQQVQDTRNRAAGGVYPTATPTRVVTRTPTPTQGGGQCAGVLQACDPVSKPCCGGQNLYCQTPAGGGQAVCQQDDGSGGNCGAGGSCTGILAFHCSSLDGSGRCGDNPRSVGSWGEGLTYAAGCGQVDKVCVGGNRPNTLCGDFTIVSNSCGGGGNTPTPTRPSGNTPTNTPSPTRTPSPTPSPTPNPQCGSNCSSNAQCPTNHTCSGNKCVLSACLQNGVNCDANKCTVIPTSTPTATVTVTYTPTPTDITGQCQNIKIYKNGAVVNPNTLQPGDSIVIAVVGTNATKARIRVNGGTFTETSSKNDAGEYILNFTIPSSGTTTFTIEAELFIGGVWR